MTLLEVLGIVVDTLESEGIRYALAGGLASNVWIREEQARETYDVDVAVLSVKPDPAIRVLEALKRAGVPVRHEEDMNLRRAKVRRILVGGIKVDFVAPADSEYVQTAFRRIGSAPLGGRKIPALSPEDVFLFKALAKRIKDIQPMVALSEAPRFDRVYVDRWARVLAIRSFVRRVLGGL